MCFQCGDYVYDRELLAVAKAQWSESAKSLSFGEFYRAWEPTQIEAELLRKHPRRRRVVENSTIGNEETRIPQFNAIITLFLYIIILHTHTHTHTFYIQRYNSLVDFRFERLDQSWENLLHELHCTSIDSHTTVARLFSC